MSIDRLFDYSIEYLAGSGRGEHGFIITLDLNSARRARETFLPKNIHREFNASSLESLKKIGYKVSKFTTGPYHFLNSRQTPSRKVLLLDNITLPTIFYCLGLVGDIFKILESSSQEGPLRYDTVNVNSERDSKAIVFLYENYAELAERLMREKYGVNPCF